MKKLLLFLVFLSSPAFADTWLQYDTSTGAVAASNSQKVSDAALSSIGRAQILYQGSNDISTLKVDLTQNPPVVVAFTPPPPPPSELDLVFNAMVQSGQIDPATIPTDLLARVNASLSTTGAKTIAVPVTGGAVTPR